MTNAMIASSPSRNHGFSLIEVMVGLVIGLIGLLVVIQVVTVWGGRTQTTTAGNDTQISGSLGMFVLERDIKQAGLGFGTATANVMGCMVKADEPIVSSFRLVPVEIVSGAVGVPQAISVLHGDSAFFSAAQIFQSSTSTTKTSKNGYGFQGGHFMVVAADGSLTNFCGMGAPQVHAMVKINSVAVAPPLAVITTFHDAGALAGTTFSAGNLYDLGAAPERNLWEIDASTPGRPVLRWSNTLTSTTIFFEAAEGIVNLQAQYGYDANSDNMIQDTEWVATLPANWNGTKVRAIRVAILARSKQYEKTPVTTVAPAPSWSTNTASCNATTLGCSFLMTDIGGPTDTNLNDTTDWRHYRYRVYEKVIPLPNMIYGTQ